MGLVFSLHASSKKECALWFSYFFVQTCFRIDKHTHLSSSCVYGNRLHFTVNMVLCILVHVYIYMFYRVTPPGDLSGFCFLNYYVNRLSYDFKMIVQ